jgi:nitroreductase
MNLAIKKMIEERTSVSKYTLYEMDSASIEELVRLSSLSPSAYNLQNWKFIAVQSVQAKSALQAAAYGQPQVLEASVTFVVCGQIEAHHSLAKTLQLSVDDNVMPEGVAQSWVKAASQSHQGNLAVQRDEAIRSASLAAMTLMYAAQAMGFGSGAMGGFDAQQVKEAFQLDANDIPVMLVTVGRAGESNWQQKIRNPVEEILRYA